MKLTEEGRAILDAGDEIEPHELLCFLVARRNIADTDDHLEALLVEIERYFDGDLLMAIAAVRSGTIAFELKGNRWRIFEVLSEGGRK
jgi:hypothetical protein